MEIIYITGNPDLGLRLDNLYEMYLDQDCVEMFEVDLNRDHKKVMRNGDGEDENGTRKNVAHPGQRKRRVSARDKIIPSIETSSEKVENALQTFNETYKEPCLKALSDLKRIRAEIQSRSKARQVKDGGKETPHE